MIKSFKIVFILKKLALDAMYTSSEYITSHSKTIFKIMDCWGYTCTFTGERLTMWTEPLFLVF